MSSPQRPPSSTSPRGGAGTSPSKAAKQAKARPAGGTTGPKGPRGSKPAAPAGGSWWAPLRRFWWIPLAAGLVAGIGVASVEGTSVGHTTSAVVNMRDASTLPNERVDLMADLDAVLKVPDVIDPVAAELGLKSNAVRGSLTVKRIEDSTLMRITATTEKGDEAFRTQLIESFLASAATYLSVDSPLSIADAKKTEAIDEYYQIITDNEGISPSDELARLQQRIVDAALEGDKAKRRKLLRFLPNVIEDAKQFELATAAKDQAISAYAELESASLTAGTTGPTALRASIIDEAFDQEAVTSSVATRRGISAGIAAAVVMAGLVLLLGRRKAAASA